MKNKLTRRIDEILNSVDAVLVKTEPIPLVVPAQGHWVSRSTPWKAAEAH